MLCPNLATQGQFICESAKGFAFALQYYGGKYKNVGANAKPLRGYFYKALRMRIIHTANLFIFGVFLLGRFRHLI